MQSKVLLLIANKEYEDKITSRLSNSVPSLRASFLILVIEEDAIVKHVDDANNSYPWLFALPIDSLMKIVAIPPSKSD